jgi:hypothetical protein
MVNTCLTLTACFLIFNIPVNSLLQHFCCFIAERIRAAVAAVAAGAGLPLMAAGGSAGIIALWNLEGRCLHHVLRDAHDASLLSLHFFSGEPLLMSSAGDNSIKQWVSLLLPYNLHQWPDCQPLIQLAAVSKLELTPDLTPHLTPHLTDRDQLFAVDAVHAAGEIDSH